jgi:ankyrin repeat protein
MTALFIACEYGCSETVDLLLSSPAIDLNLKDGVIIFSVLAWGNSTPNCLPM